MQNTAIDNFTTSERLTGLKDKLRLVALATESLEDDNAALVGNELWGIIAELGAIADAVHPEQPIFKQVRAIREKAERRVGKAIAELAR